MTKTLLFTVGGKGGVGKTLALVTLADYLENAGKTFAALDFDPENRHKPSSFSHFVPGAVAADLRSVADCDMLLMSTAQSPAPITLADLPAAAGGDFHDWFRSAVTPSVVQKLRLRVIACGVITPEPATTASLLQWAARLQDAVSYCVVLNHRTLQRVSPAREALFEEYYHSTHAADFRAAMKPVEVELPGLYAGSMTQLIRSGVLPSRAEQVEEIPLLDRSRVGLWSESAREQWRQAAEQLFPA